MKTLVIIIVVIILLVSAAFLGYWYFSDRGEEGNETVNKALNSNSVVNGNNNINSQPASSGEIEGESDLENLNLDADLNELDNLDSELDNPELDLNVSI